MDHTTFHGEQSVQFSSDDVARIMAIALIRVLEELNVQHVVEGIAVLPAGDSTYLVDIVMRDLSRILTDASGSFYTVVLETTVESMAEWERRIAEIFSQPEFGVWFVRMTPLVESGRREFYNY